MQQQHKSSRCMTGHPAGVSIDHSKAPNLKHGTRLQVTKQRDTINQAYKRLQSTAMVTKLGLTLDELVWAVDVTTSRSFAIPTNWLNTLRGRLHLAHPESKHCEPMNLTGMLWFQVQATCLSRLLEQVLFLHRRLRLWGTGAEEGGPVRVT